MAAHRTIYYINDTDLFYELRLSQGKGYVTERLAFYIILIADNFIRRKIYMNNELKEDCYQTAVESMLNNYTKFNHKKYSKALPYMTEICKRGLAAGFKEYFGNIKLVTFDTL